MLTWIFKSIISALTEGRGNDSGIVGMASMDLRFMEITLYQFFETTAYTLLKTTLHLLDPVEVYLKYYKSPTNF